jgi:hypothetical protein
MLQRLVNLTISGEVLVYVDDFCACSPLNIAEVDRSVTREITVQLMGSDSVTANKWEMGRRVDFVGWDFDLDTRRVTLSRKNHYKAVYYFFTVDTSKPQLSHTMQALASRATRYSTVCRHMRPYTAAFYAMTTQYGESSSVMRRMSVLAVMDVHITGKVRCNHLLRFAINYCICNLVATFMQ